MHPSYGVVYTLIADHYVTKMMFPTQVIRSMIEKARPQLFDVKKIQFRDGKISRLAPFGLSFSIEKAEGIKWFEAKWTYSYVVCIKDTHLSQMLVIKQALLLGLLKRERFSSARLFRCHAIINNGLN